MYRNLEIGSPQKERSESLYTGFGERKLQGMSKEEK
jgi:hypothetical protein